MASEATFGDLSQDPLSRLVNAEIEQAFLGACLMNNGAFLRTAGMLVPEDFGYSIHGKIYEAIGKLIDRGHTATAVTLKDMLAADLAESGGAGYLGKLIAGAVIVSNAPHYAESIADFSRRRKLIEACNDTIADAATIDVERSAMAVIEDHEQRVFELAERHTDRGPVAVETALDEALRSAGDAYRRDGGLSGVTTGLLDLDQRLGGLMPGNLEIVAGRPSMGKTSLAAGMGLAAAMAGTPVAIFSLEETRTQLGQRLLAMRAGVGADKQRRGDLDRIQWADLAEAKEHISRLPITIDDTSGLAVTQIVQRARRLKRQRGIGLIIVDHLQHVRVPGKSENRRLEIGTITRALKAIAKDLEIPVVLLSQLSRANESRDNKRPILSDLRESGDIEQDADRVMFVFREEYYLERDEPARRSDEADQKFNDRVERHQRALSEAGGKGEIIIAKNRHGPATTVRVRWDASRTMFGNLARPS